MFRHARRPAALMIALFVMACAASSPKILPDKSADLTKAQTELTQRLDCPPPPPALTQCQDGSTPVAGISGTAPLYRCPLPPDLAGALNDGTLWKDVPLNATAALMRETDLRFRTLDWFKPCRPAAPPPR